MCLRACVCMCVCVCVNVCGVCCVLFYFVRRLSMDATMWMPCDVSRWLRGQPFSQWLDLQVWERVDGQALFAMSQLTVETQGYLSPYFVSPTIAIIATPPLLAALGKLFAPMSASPSNVEAAGSASADPLVKPHHPVALSSLADVPPRPVPPAAPAPPRSPSPLRSTESSCCTP